MEQHIDLGRTENSWEPENGWGIHFHRVGHILQRESKEDCEG